MDRNLKSIEDISPSVLEALRARALDVKLLATDLDGTLLDRQHLLRNETRSVLGALANRGIVLAAATGRARSSIPEAITSLPGLKYLITANGAKIYRNESGEIIFAKYLDLRAIDYIRPFYKDPEVMLEFFWDGKPHVEESKYDAARDYGIPRWFSDYFFSTRKPLKNLEKSVAERAQEIENINFVFGDEQVQKRVFDYLMLRTDLYELTSSFPFNFEIGGIGVSKGAALDFIARREGILKEEIISFGDQINDVDMIEYAGIGVATANAVAPVLEAADFITHDNENEGVAAALKLLRLV